MDSVKGCGACAAGTGDVTSVCVCVRQVLSNVKDLSKTMVLVCSKSVSAGRAIAVQGAGGCKERKGVGRQRNRRGETGAEGGEWSGRAR